MKKSITLSLAAALIAAPALGYKQEDLEKLKSTMVCVDCDLKEAPLSGANLIQANLRSADLSKADLTGAVFRGAQLDFTNLSKAIFCNTVMPDGQRIFKDC